jgi:hypothetical protein
MNNDALRRDLFLLTGYLLTSAHNLYQEPAGYGPFRLMDTAGRLLELMETHGLADPFTTQLLGAIQTERFGSSNNEELRDFLNKLSLQYATELKQRLSLREDKE